MEIKHFVKKKKSSRGEYKHMATAFGKDQI